MFENPRRGRQAKNFTTNVPKILDLKSSSEQIFFRKLSLSAPDMPRHIFHSQVLISKDQNLPEAPGCSLSPTDAGVSDYDL